MNNDILKRMCENVGETVVMFFNDPLQPNKVWYHTKEKEVFEIRQSDLELMRFIYGNRPYTGREMRCFI